MDFTRYSLRHAGPIFSLNFAGQPVLVVGNASMAADLMVCPYIARSQPNSSLLS